MNPLPAEPQHLRVLDVQCIPPDSEHRVHPDVHDTEVLGNLHASQPHSVGRNHLPRLRPLQFAATAEGAEPERAGRVRNDVVVGRPGRRRGHPSYDVPPPGHRCLVQHRSSLHADLFGGQDQWEVTDPQNSDQVASRRTLLHLHRVRPAVVDLSTVCGDVRALAEEGAGLPLVFSGNNDVLLSARGLADAVDARVLRIEAP